MLMGPLRSGPYRRRLGKSLHLLGCECIVAANFAPPKGVLRVLMTEAVFFPPRISSFAIMLVATNFIDIVRASTLHVIICTDLQDCVTKALGYYARKQYNDHDEKERKIVDTDDSDVNAGMTLLPNHRVDGACLE